MTTFIINLDKNTLRLEKIDRQLTHIGVRYTRIRAIYGKDLPQGQKRGMAKRFAWWCVKGYAMRDGELGAALSHQLIYRKMVEQDVPLACVFEDDANPNVHLPEQLKRIEAVADPTKPQVYLLSDHTKEKNKDWSIRQLEGGAFAEGYILTLSAAKALLLDNFPVKTPADSWSYWVQKGIIELYQTTPASCDQAWEAEGYCSDVTPDNTKVADVRRMSTMQKIIWKMKRTIGLILAKIFY